MEQTVNWVVVGRFGRPHGIKGLITVHSFTVPRDNILGYVNWHVCLSKQWRSVVIESLEARDNVILARIEGYATPEQVSALTNADIAIDAAQLPSLAEGDYYWHELVGMNVINQEGVVFGKVSGLMATGANDVLIVEGEKRHLIPYLPGRFIVEINTDRHLVIVDWDQDF